MFGLPSLPPLPRKSDVKCDGQGSVPHEPPRAEARFPFFELCGTTGSRALPDLAVGAICGSFRRSQQRAGGGNPLRGGDARSGYGVLRLRMTSTSWASCFAQDDKAYWDSWKSISGS
jgi:hypothetical protein